MNKHGEIIIVDDDMDNLDILQEVYSLLPYSNRLVVFNDGGNAYSYLKVPDTHPFLIISDINMPKMNGFELRDRVFADAEVAGKIIPFVFMSTCANRATMKAHCQNSFHGYFEKKGDFTQIQSMLEKIIGYWNDAIPSF